MKELPVGSITHTLKEGDYVAGGEGAISLPPFDASWRMLFENPQGQAI